MSDAAPISPRGIPPIRTDWLADVAWRLAAIGLDRLRALGTEPITLTDIVDGERWRLEPARWSDPSDVVVELDGDVYLPSDEGAPTLRIGVGITPKLDAARGRLLEVRIEIGPRGAVTFDPENWIYAFAVDAVASGERPAVPRLEAGEFDGVPAVQASEVLAVDVARLELHRWLPSQLALGSLVALAEGRASWNATLGLLHPAPRRGLLRRREWRTVAVLSLIADGPLRVEPAAPLVAAEFAERQLLEAIDVADASTLVLTLAGLDVPDGRIQVVGEGLRASLHRITDR